MYKGTSRFVNESGWGRKETDHPGKRYMVVTYHLQMVHNKKVITSEKEVVVRKEEECVSLRRAEDSLKTKRFGYSEILEKEGSTQKLKKQKGDPSLKSRYEERTR